MTFTSVPLACLSIVRSIKTRRDSTCRLRFPSRIDLTMTVQSSKADWISKKRRPMSMPSFNLKLYSSFQKKHAKAVKPRKATRKHAAVSPTSSKFYSRVCRYSDTHSIAQFNAPPTSIILLFFDINLTFETKNGTE